ncbi:glycosyltransferase family 4 protein [Marinobacter salinisoli]|uniref:Glycosyltransferase family 4 protein n=1 Tax=Marinobacter salinisoli TaxID=2769486 RepID=A0ABX7MNK1_9GAMM|nr:glycosyltransferase family 4 protein [Marinobacter salinisoli]QSP93679.1 glycosyltransferase family 4 protein [Marinobacter salinisoli]
MTAILVLFHCESNPGYAASSHEHTFLDVALKLVGDYSRVHYAYSRLDGGMTPSLPKALTNVIQLDTQWSAPSQLADAEQYIRQHKIKYLLGFDQPVSRPMYQALRRGGVETFVSYWGAPMSSVNTGLKLLLKKLEVSTKKFGPDHYIFQSAGMRDTAVKGRGIPKWKTSIVKTGIDTDKYAPDEHQHDYAHQAFDIPRNRKIIVFSGHMERRKGVHVILQAAQYLTQKLGRQDVHFLILGNRPGEKERFEEFLTDEKTNDHITFGGYRTDIPKLLKSCTIGMIASVEWDSFPMSSLEMASSGLPLLVSDLPGLNEAVTQQTGLRFPVGDYVHAANALNELLNNPDQIKLMGTRGRQRVKKHFSRQSQSQGITDIFEEMKEQKLEHAN